MKKNFIKIDSLNGYLNLKDLPYNCIFNKVVTGCGGTTIALSNDENYVIAVPTLELITNKTDLLEPDTCTLYGHNVITVFKSFPTIKDRLVEFDKLDGVKKIICTYDQIENVVNTINSKNYRLLVDEYHRLLKDYSYRDKAILRVLKNYKLFKSFCFMSATPIAEDFVPSALEGVSYVECEWVNGTDRLFVHLDKTNKPYLRAANIINSYKEEGQITINGLISKHAFFFINSVTDITSIISHCELTPEESKLIVADTPQNRDKIKALNGTFKISTTNDKSDKMFTFITCKAFEGADFFSDDAVTFVVSNTKLTHTQLDISTDICQIAGRIRTKENPFRNFIFHIFNTTGKNKINTDLTYEEVKELMIKDRLLLQENADALNTTSEETREATKLKFPDFFTDDYIFIDNDNVYQVNDTLMKLRLFNYKLEQEIYKNGLSILKNYNKTGIITDDGTWNEFKEKMTASSKKITFKEAFVKYAEIKSNPFYFGDEENLLLKAQPLIRDAYYKLGADNVKSLKYNKKNIQTALLNADTSKTNELKIKERVLRSFNTGFISTADIKNILTEIYADYNMKAKTKDIEKYFICKETRKRIDNVQVRGYEIGTQK